LPVGSFLEIPGRINHIPWFAGDLSDQDGTSGMKRRWLYRRLLFSGWIGDRRARDNVPAGTQALPGEMERSLPCPAL